jgi:hypothetical protein
LKKLKRDGAPKRPTKVGSQALAEWWGKFRSASAGVRRTPTEFLSNWLRPPRSAALALAWSNFGKRGHSREICAFCHRRSQERRRR